jgi:hypothetical protein
MVTIDMIEFDKSFESFFETGQEILTNVLAAGQNLGVKLEKVALTSRAELAEPSSLAYQKNLAVV